jgi:hypothetical protein
MFGVLNVKVEPFEGNLNCNVYGCEETPTHTLRIGGGNMTTVQRLCRKHLVELGQQIVYALGGVE